MNLYVIYHFFAKLKVISLWLKRWSMKDSLVLRVMPLLSQVSSVQFLPLEVRLRCLHNVLPASGEEANSSFSLSAEYNPLVLAIGWFKLGTFKGKN